MTPTRKSLTVAFLAQALVLAAGMLPASAQLFPISPRASLFQSLPPPAFPAAPPTAQAAATPGQQCRAAIRAAEQAAAIPSQLMAAIGRVESGRREPDGSVDPWPWSINAEGEPHVYQTKAEAVAAVRALQARGMRSIDVGCMQVNLLHHPDAFASLDQAFDPVANAAYAARFLRQLHDETGTWPTATAWYHSATPDKGADYQRKVMAVLPEEKRRQEADPAQKLASSASAAAAGGFASGMHGGFGSGMTHGVGAITARPAGGFAIDNGAANARILPLPMGAAPGRGLAAYRAMPIAVVTRPYTIPATVPPAGPREPGKPG